MAKFEIQGVELEFDILDLESAEIYEKALDEVKKRAEKSLGDIWTPLPAFRQAFYRA